MVDVPNSCAHDLSIENCNVDKLTNDLLSLTLISSRVLTINLIHPMEAFFQDSKLDSFIAVVTHANMSRTSINDVSGLVVQDTFYARDCTIDNIYHNGIRIAAGAVAHIQDAGIVNITTGSIRVHGSLSLENVIIYNAPNESIILYRDAQVILTNVTFRSHAPSVFQMKGRHNFKISNVHMANNSVRIDQKLHLVNNDIMSNDAPYLENSVKEEPSAEEIKQDTDQDAKDSDGGKKQSNVALGSVLGIMGIILVFLLAALCKKHRVK